MLDIWKESFWLPNNVRWKDIENGPNEDVVYGTASDLWTQVPLVAMIFILRYVCERYIFKPFGKSLKIRDKRNRKAPINDVLEMEYRKSSRLKELSSIAKKVEMSERQVERWWRLRRNQDKPSTLVKFCENMWKGTFYIFKETYAILALSNEDWFWNVNLCIEGYPHHGVTSDIWWYYMISSAFYWSLTISQFWDVRRKDFWQMFLHHIATIALLCFSWVCNLHRIGSLVLLTHDPTDIFLELAKAAKYAQKDRITTVLFGNFVIIWIALRLYVFPVFVLYGARDLFFYCPLFACLYLLLICLMMLNVMWTYFIVKVIYRMLSGKDADDVRSSSSDESDAINNNELNNKKKKIK